MRIIPVADVNNSRQPVLPQSHLRSLVGSTVVCPISPAEPSAPRHNFPSTIIPPPTPVPSVKQTILRQPCPAPTPPSPTAAAFASFSKITVPPNSLSKVFLSSKPSRQGRCGALITFS